MRTVQRTEANARGTGHCTVLCVIYTLLVHCGSFVNYFNPLTHHRYLEVIDLLSFSIHLEDVLHIERIWSTAVVLRMCPELQQNFCCINRNIKGYFIYLVSSQLILSQFWQESHKTDCNFFSKLQVQCVWFRWI